MVEQLLPVFSLFLRTFAAIAFLPLGAGFSGARLKVSLAAVLAVCLGLAVPQAQPVTVGGVLAELAIGCMLGMPSALVVQAAYMWGALVDWGRGQTIGGIYDALSARVQPVSSTLMKWMVWVVLLVPGGMEILIEALAHSYLTNAPFGCGVSDLLHHAASVTRHAVWMLTRMMCAYVPLAVLFLLVDLGGGFVAKCIPQTIVFAEAFLIKTMLALLGIGLIVHLGLVPFQKSFFTP